MPGDLRHAVSFRGTEEYRNALAELAGACGVRGPNELAKLALVQLARRKGIKLPEPTPQWGGPRMKADDGQ